MSFKYILDALSEEEAVLSLARPSIENVVVPENAQAWAIASYIHLIEANSLFVITPTIAEASSLQFDLQTILGIEEVEIFPAWEVLPFERVSPTLQTMGQRAKLAWELQNSQGPKVVISPIRATTQIVAPINQIQPVVISRNEFLDLQESLQAFLFG